MCYAIHVQLVSMLRWGWINRVSVTKDGVGKVSLSLNSCKATAVLSNNNDQYRWWSNARCTTLWDVSSIFVSQRGEMGLWEVTENKVYYCGVFWSNKNTKIYSTHLSPYETLKEMKFCLKIQLYSPPPSPLHSLISHKLCHYNKTIHSSFFKHLWSSK